MGVPSNPALAFVVVRKQVGYVHALALTVGTLAVELAGAPYIMAASVVGDVDVGAFDCLGGTSWNYLPAAVYLRNVNVAASGRNVIFRQPVEGSVID